MLGVRCSSKKGVQANRLYVPKDTSEKMTNDLTSDEIRTLLKLEPVFWWGETQLALSLSNGSRRT
jgi:hypothetical protein